MEILPKIITVLASIAAIGILILLFGPGSDDWPE